MHLGDMPENGVTEPPNTSKGVKPEQTDTRPRERKKVEFTDSQNESPGTLSTPDPISPIGAAIGLDESVSLSAPPSRKNSLTGRLSPELEHELSRGVYEAFGQPFPPRPKPAIRKGGSSTPLPEQYAATESNVDPQKAQSGRMAHERAQRLAQSIGGSTVSSPQRMSFEEDDAYAATLHQIPESIPTIQVDGNQEDLESDDEEAASKHHLNTGGAHDEALNLVRAHTTKGTPFTFQDGLRSGHVTPRAEQAAMEDYVPEPEKYRHGILSSILRLYDMHGSSMAAGLGGSSERGSRSASMAGTFSSPSTRTNTPQHSPLQSGTSTPKKHWYSKSGSHSTVSLNHLVGSSLGLASHPDKNFHSAVTEKLKREKLKRNGMGKRTFSGDLQHAFHKIGKQKMDAYRIKIHLAEVISRQRYLTKLCRALMEYGAPTHRLEEYLRMSARVLEIESQFLYIPGCMIMSFDDSHTHTTEVKLVRTSHGLDFGKLRDTHEIYKDVVHDQIGVDEAMARLDEVMKSKPKFNVWIRVLMYGLASVCVGPFAFQARLIDLPIAFLLGCLVGVMQLVIAPQSDIYANVFEIAAAVITSFLARAFGSINHGNTFCFSALAQSSIALILPGYTVLCASLELQSRSIIAGSVRMVYAIIYSLFLGFGITIGSVIYGLMDENATSQTQCSNPMPAYWFFWFVPAFTFCLIIINQAKWKQVPLMMIIAFAGYVVNYFSSKRFSGNAQISNTLGALAIGFLANIHSRLGPRLDNWSLDVWESHIRPFLLRIGCGTLHRKFRCAATSGTDSEKPEDHTRRRRVGYGLAAAAMLPAIFVQVPSGLAVNGSLVSGITSADQITRNATGTTTVSSGSDMTEIDNVAFNVGYSVIQVAIGITVGLFLSALFVYPLGKRRSGLFSF